MTVITRRNWKQCLCNFFFWGGGEGGGETICIMVSMKMVNSRYSPSVQALLD